MGATGVRLSNEGTGTELTQQDLGHERKLSVGE